MSDHQVLVERLFKAAIQKDTSARTEYLDAISDIDPDLRKDVETLLAAHSEDRAGERLSADSQSLGEESVEALTAIRPPSKTDAPSRIGPYRIVREVGKGGMGVVYEAEQQRPVRRKVAVKLIKWGMDTKAVVARFESERQAIALMNHPNIASVYDAGATHEGRPYFAMEYVQGIPITEYCDKHRLTIERRLKLFTQLCDGVQHAHQKGIIHRDIKPSNILVEVQNDEPIAKIIDFGVAKATSQRLTEHTVATELGQLIGTPEYMSPEQAEMTNLDIDTRTDVYSLGVLLYELLVGSPPFDSKSFREGSIEEIGRKIREDEPPRPSSRLTTLGERASTISHARRLEQSSLRSELQGDLDWISMKAIDKDRTRRYTSASELAMDIERFLTHQPVLAGPPSAVYRMRKFVRRHRLGVAVSAVAFFVLIGFAALMTAQAERIARERDRANRAAAAQAEVASFLKELFEVSNPSEARGNSLTAREILDKGVQRIDDRLDDQPEVRAEMLFTMGEVYTNLGLYREAELMLRRALQLQRQSLEADHVATFSTLHELGYTLFLQGHYDEASASFLEAFEKRRAILGPRDARTLASGSQVANTYAELGRYEQGEALFREIMAAEQDVLGERHPDRLVTMNNLASLYRSQERYDDAATLDREILDVRSHEIGEDHPLTISTLNNLAVDYRELGRYDEAKSLMERAIRIARRVWGDEHPNYGIFVHTLGELEMAMDHPAEAESEFRRALEIYELQHSHEYTGLVLYQLAQVSARQKKLNEAVEFLTRALDAGYIHDGSLLGFVNDPALSSLQGHMGFDALVAASRASLEP